MLFMIITTLFYAAIFTICAYGTLFFNALPPVQLFTLKLLFATGGLISSIRIYELTHSVFQYYSGKEQYESTDEALVVGKYKVPWTEIKGFYHYRKFLSDYIAVAIKDPERYIERNGNKSRTIRANFKRSGALFLIRAYSNAFNKEDILKNLEYDLNKHLKMLKEKTNSIPTE